MKKFLLASLVAIFTLGAVTVPTINVKAQTTRLVSKTITGVDTITYLNVPSKIKSFTYTLTKTSGTAAGNVILEASNITGQWTPLDTLALANVTTLQQKTVLITATSYVSYRYRNTNTSAATCAVKTTYLRRADE